MLTTALSVVFTLTFLAELWMGIAVPGITPEQPFIERQTHPGPYWFMMSLQGVATVGLFVLSYFVEA